VRGDAVARRRRDRDSRYKELLREKGRGVPPPWDLSSLNLPQTEDGWLVLGGKEDSLSFTYKGHVVHAAESYL